MCTSCAIRIFGELEISLIKLSYSINVLYCVAIAVSKISTGLSDKEARVKEEMWEILKKKSLLEFNVIKRLLTRQQS